MRGLLAHAEALDPDVVREVLVCELTAALALDRVTVIESAKPAPQIIDTRPALGRSVVLEYSLLGGQESVKLAPGQQRGLDRDEREIAAAIVQTAAVILRLLGAQRDAATDVLTGCLNRRAMLRRLPG